MPRLFAVVLALSLTLIGFTSALSAPEAAAADGNTGGAGVWAGSTYVPDGAAVREENSYLIFMVVNGGKLYFQTGDEFYGMGYTLPMVYVVPQGALAGVPDRPNRGTMVRERYQYAIFYMDGTTLNLVPSMDVFNQTGYSMAQVHVVPNGSLGLIPRGPDITTAGTAYNGSDREYLSSGYRLVDTDTLHKDSENGKARLTGGIKWYAGEFPKAYVGRGNIMSGTKVDAVVPVGCIYAQVRWGFPAGSLSFPPNASISGASEVGEFFRSCTSGSETRPSPINLSGLGYAKGWLNSVTITVCNSAQASDGPRNCSYEKVLYDRG